MKKIYRASLNCLPLRHVNVNVNVNVKWNSQNFSYSYYEISRYL